MKRLIVYTAWDEWFENPVVQSAIKAEHPEADAVAFLQGLIAVNAQVVHCLLEGDEVEVVSPVGKELNVSLWKDPLLVLTNSFDAIQQWAVRLTGGSTTDITSMKKKRPDNTMWLQDVAEGAVGKKKNSKVELLAREAWIAASTLIVAIQEGEMVTVWETARTKAEAGLSMLVTSDQQLQDVYEDIRQLKRDVPVAIDFETEGAYPFMTPVGFSVSYEKAGEQKSWYIPLKHKQAEWNAELTDAQAFLLQVVRSPWIAHNALFESHCLLSLGVWPPPVLTNLQDTMFQAWHLQKPETGLKALMDIEYGEKRKTYKQVAGDTPFGDLPMQIAAPYGAQDATDTLRLYKLYQPQLAGRREIGAYNIDKAMIGPVMEMERDGVRLNVPKVELWMSKQLHLLDELEVKLVDAAGGINIRSTIQLSDYLFQSSSGPQLTPTKKTQKGYSTDESVLLLYKDVPFVSDLLEYRKQQKLYSTYGLGMLSASTRHGDGRVHFEYRINGTKPGRMSSANPNAQNVPAFFREFFEASPGHTFVGADYGQVELRLAAFLSGDSVLLSAFREGRSPHMDTFQSVFGRTDKEQFAAEYTLSKNINFGSIYGMAWRKYQEQARAGGIEVSDRAAQKAMEGHRQLYRRLWEWAAQREADIKAKGFVYTLQGKRCEYPEVFWHNPDVVAEAVREARNAEIQGSAGLGTKDAMGRLHIVKPSWMRFRFNIHDEIIVEVPLGREEEAAALLQHYMVAALEDYVDVPISVEWHAATNWKGLK